MATQTTKKTRGTPYSSPVSREFQGAKIPPNASDLERILIGSVIIEKEALSHAIEILSPENFYVPSHQMIFSAIIKLFEDSKPVDILTVTEALKKMGNLDAIGGSYYLVDITSKISSASNSEEYCRIILEKSIQRELIRISSKISSDAYEETNDVFDLLDTAEKGIFSVTEGHLRKNYDKMSVLIKKALEQIKNACNEEETMGVMTGFTGLDKLLGGMQPADLLILAARPSMGKTALALNIARNCAVQYNKAVAVFSLEMNSIQLVTRLISSESLITSERLREGNLNEKEYEQLVNNVTKLDEASMFIDETAQLSTFELRAKCRRLKANYDIKLILIDYLQLMQSSSGKGNREQEISSISRSIKSLAKELEVPIIALSQLSRSVEHREGDNKPRLSDLRESGAIEQDADVVMFIYRPDYYGQTEGLAGENISGLAEVIVAKHRNGPTGDVVLRFNKEYTKFENVDDDEFGAIENQKTEYKTASSKMNKDTRGKDDFRPY